VRSAAHKFLPRNVRLKAWIEYRIGGEIEIKPGRRGEDIHLTEQARMTVRAKSEQILQQDMMRHGPPPPHMAMMPPVGYPHPPPFAGPPGPPMPHHPGMMQHGRGPAPPPPVNKDAWFDSLPADMLLPTELNLREALMNWIQRWPKTKIPTLNDASNDTEVRRSKIELLPPKFRLAEWIERRIGGEIELRPNRDGHDIFLRGDGQAVGAGRASNRGTQADREEWFDQLPADDFTIHEQNLREALLRFLSEWKGAKPPTNSDLAADAEVLECRRKLLPPGCRVSHRQWIDRRIGGEIETRSDGPNGQWSLGWRGTFEAGSGQGGENRKRRRAR